MEQPNRERVRLMRNDLEQAHRVMALVLTTQSPGLSKFSNLRSPAMLTTGALPSSVLHSSVLSSLTGGDGSTSDRSISSRGFLGLVRLGGMRLDRGSVQSGMSPEYIRSPDHSGLVQLTARHTPAGTLSDWPTCGCLSLARSRSGCLARVGLVLRGASS